MRRSSPQSTARGHRSPSGGLLPACIVVLAAGAGAACSRGDVAVTRAWAADLRAAKEAQAKSLAEYGVVDAAAGRYTMPVDAAMDAVAAEPSLLAPIPIAFVPTGDPVATGKTLFEVVHPCSTCHTVDGTPKIGPSLKGLFGSTRTFTDGSTAVADEAYIIASIKDPASRIVQGFQPVMTQLPISDGDIESLLAYLKSLQ